MAKEKNIKKDAADDKEEKEFALETKDVSVLKKKIKYLEEELVRKDKEVEKLKQENILLFRTALKHSESKVDNKKYEEKKE
jgi:hypothetical protein